MKTLYGIILLDKTETVLRVYQIKDGKWQLLHYFSKNVTEDLPPFAFVDIIAEIFSLPYTQKVLDWNVCSKDIPTNTVQEIETATGLHIEPLQKHREQELICKGIFTETW